MTKVYNQIDIKDNILEKSDLERKKEIARKGMYISAGVTVASSFFTNNDFFKTLNTSAALSTIGFSLWNYTLNNPNKFSKKGKIPLAKKIEFEENQNLSISLNNFYIELSIKGTLTKNEFNKFEQKIESLLELYKIPKINILIDIKEIKSIEFKSLWDDFLFAIRHFKEIKKVSIVGNKKIEKFSINLMDKIVQNKEFRYFKEYEEAHKWLLK